MDYILEEVLYTGSETRILRGRHPKSGARVVLKMPREDAPTPRFLEKLRHEYALLRALEGPGVLRTVGLEPHGQGLALVMELWGDTSLNQLIAQHPLSGPTALHLGAVLARTLGRVHRHGIIHCDVKPQNILVDADRRDIRLIDFGIATRWGQRVQATAAVATLAGTLAYMAPEQTGRMNRAMDTRADLYALGATLYELLVGALPFETTDALELIHAHIAKVPAPPHLRAPERQIPEMVSAIVLKLMANSPEDRYQTADGAAFDLERAAKAWAETGTVVPFELATRDWTNRIRQPSRLFGRETESAVMEAAFAKACDGQVVLALVRGPSGVGKSALVQALRERVREHQGIFAPGKFDQLQRGTPYSALAQALRSIVRRRLADPPGLLEYWKRAWQEAAEPNGRILVELMPELVHILGEPKPLIEVGPLEAKSRFQMTVQRFVRTLGTAGHPLLLFIDDMQWADPASLVLLQELLTDPGGRKLLVVGAFRSDEVDASHPLQSLIEAVKSKGVAVETLTLAALGEAALSAMVADMLDRPMAETNVLSQLIKEKTDGSPFFVGQFLQALQEQSLLSRDTETGRWQWQQKAIEQAGITDNVVTLLTHRLQELSPALQKMLQTAACIGNRFELDLLAHLEGQSSEELCSTLDEAVREGLVLHEGESGHDAYAFVHDRVRQAAYEVLAPEERLEAHLVIGRQLRARYGAACADDDLFATLYHRNEAAALLRSTEEKRDLAEQNLRAGQRAKASTAYTEAAGFLKVGQALLGEEGWIEAYDLTFETHLNMAETLTLGGQGEGGEILFRCCLERARNDVERARVARVWLPLLTVAGQFAQGVELGLVALAWLGHPLPRTPEEHQALFGQLLTELEPKVEAMTVEDWKALPFSTNHANDLACQILEDLGTCASLGQPSLSPCCWTMIVPLTLRHGLTKNSLTGLSTTALFLAYLMGRFSLARRLADATFALLDHYDARGGIAIAAAAQASHYWISLGRVREFYLQSESASAAEGNVAIEGMCSAHARDIQLLQGVRLPQITHVTSEQASRDVTAIDFRVAFELTTAALSESPASNEEGGDPARVLDRLVNRPWHSNMTAFFAKAHASWVGLHLGADAWAARTAVATEPLWPASWGQTSLHVFTLSICVALSHCLPDASDEERPVWDEKLAFHAARLALRAESYPATFLHMRLLVDAGRARRAGKHEQASHLYDEAIEDANQNGFLNDVALGLRLAGEHYLERGKLYLARTYLTAAQDAYQRWGALAAASQIRERHPEFFPASAPGRKPDLGRSSSRDASFTETTSTITRKLGGIDGVTVLKASQAFATEMDLQRLLDKVLRIAVENAGAERGVLLLPESGQLLVKAEYSSRNDGGTVLYAEPLGETAVVPQAIVRLALRTQSPVVLADATQEGSFTTDPYVIREKPRSVLCTPILHLSDVKGVLYLENNLATGAFTDDRTQVLTVLSSQMAISIENASLYTDLERIVAERTSELREAQARLVALGKEATEIRMAGGFAHEMRNVLTGAKVLLNQVHSGALSDGASSLFLENSHKLKDLYLKVKEYVPPEVRTSVLETLRDIIGNEQAVDTIVADVDKALTRGLATTQAILDYARLGQARPGVDPVPMCPLVTAILKESEGDFATHGISVEVAIAPDDVLIGKELHFYSILKNLVLNARDALAEQEDLCRRSITISLMEETTAHVLCVSDTGPGIPPEDRARIFEPFFTTKPHHGTGLGLGVVRKLVLLYEGTIEVESEPGRGTIFRITIPRLELRPSPPNAFASRTDPPA